jgi:large subunit ribosomal protein L9
VILLEDVEGLGKAGEAKDVAPGYARNYLFPRKVAAEATSGQLKQLQEKRAREERQQQKKMSDAASLATRLSAIPLVFKVKVGEQHRLYGSVSAKDIADALQFQSKMTIDRHWVQLDEPIRAVGTFDVGLRLAQNIHGTVKVTVEPE